MSRLRFGTFFFFQAAPGQRHEDIIRNELTQVEWSEELGFDEVWFTEHHFIDYGLSVDPATLAVAAASRTRRVRIGLAAAILPFHHPLRLAEQMALVDILSDGRLDSAITVLIIEHDMDIALEVARHVTVLHYGRVIADGTRDAVRADPTVREIYLGA